MSSFGSAVTLLSPHPCKSTRTLSFATQSPLKASATAIGKEAFPTSVSEPLVAGRWVRDIKTSFLTALVPHYLFFCPPGFCWPEWCTVHSLWFVGCFPARHVCRPDKEVHRVHQDQFLSECTCQHHVRSGEFSLALCRSHGLTSVAI